MSIFKAFFSLGKIPEVIRYYEFRSFDEVNKMGGYLHALKNEARITGRKFSPSQEKYIEDQFRQVKLVFEQIEKHGKQEKAIKKASSAKVFDLKGKEIDPDMPIMGGTQKSEAAIKTKLEASNKKSADRIRIDKIKKEISDLETQINEAEEARSFWSVDEYKKNEEKLSDLITKRNDKEIELELYEDFTGPEDFAGGGIAGMLGEPTYEEDNHRVPLKWGKRPITAGLQVLDPDFDDEDFDMEGLIKLLEQMTQERWRGKYQTGGRIGFSEGKGPKMSRRTFLKGIGALAALPVVGKFFKWAKPASKVADLTQVPIKNADGMPSWFKPLVNRVIQEGDDITKQAAWKERQIVHSKKLGEEQGVRVTQDLDNQTITVEYQSADNMGGVDDAVRLEYKAAEEIEPILPQHMDPKDPKGFWKPHKDQKTKPTFEANEAYPLQDPKDYKYITWEDSNIATNVDDLFSDTSALKQFATGKDLSKKELAIAKQKRKRVKKINEDPHEELAGSGPDYDPYDDFASGGRVPMWLGGGLGKGKDLLRAIMKHHAETGTTGLTGSKMLQLVNPKQFNEMLNKPEGIPAIAKEMIEKYIKEMKVDRVGAVEHSLGLAKKMKKAKDKSKEMDKITEALTKDFVDKGMDKEMVEGLIEMFLKAKYPDYQKVKTIKALPNVTDEAILELENIQKNLATKGRKLNASGGLAGMLGE